MPTSPRDLSELTVKLKKTRKKLKQVAAKLDSVTDSNARLEEEVLSLRQVQGRLMHNLRRVLRHLELTPSRE